MQVIRIHYHSMQVFYFPHITGNQVHLDEAESKHCIRVLRLEKGSIVQLVDGKGGFYDAEIVEPDPKRCRLQIIRSIQDFGKRDFYVHIAIAPTKNTDRFEWFAEKATETGIDEITPLFCTNSERKILKTERIEKVVVAAMKQSLKACLPKINQPVDFKNFVGLPFTGKKFIAHCSSGEKRHLKDLVDKTDRVLILIGPEGDFTLREVNDARLLGFTEVSLGKNRLRTETAGLIACHIVNLANE